MIARSEAEEHLRVIRSLMEKATIYRALSAPAALVGGLLSLAAAGGLALWQRRENAVEISSSTFATVWGVVFVCTAAVSLVLIKRDAVRRGEPFISVGFRSALRAMLPAMAFAALFTLAALARKGVHYCVPWWISFYGLALLAMSHFAPRSIARLGWAFLLAGAVAVGGMLDIALGSRLPYFIDAPCLLMAATFGFFHLIYAACTWPRRAT
jgi:hypothetical protein